MTMPGRKFIAGNGYRYGFGSKEKTNEIYGEENTYDFGARIHDPRLGRWLSVDPLFGEYPHQSPYASMSNDPINRIDPTGMGDYYGKDGTHLGSDGKTLTIGKGKKAKKVADDKAYTTSQEIINQYTKDGKTDWDAVIGNSGTSQLSVSNSTLGKYARAVAEESSGDQQESYAIASAIVNLSKFKGKDILYTLQNYGIFGYNGTSDFTNKEYSMGAAINALTGGTDYSGGAIRWDGFDLATKGFNHIKSRQFGFEISQGHFDQFKLAWPDNALSAFSGNTNSTFSSNFSSGVRVASEGENIGRCLYKSTAVHGKTMFWGVNRDPIVLKLKWYPPMSPPASPKPSFSNLFGLLVPPPVRYEKVHVNSGYKKWGSL